RANDLIRSEGRASFIRPRPAPAGRPGNVMETIAPAATRRKISRRCSHSEDCCDKAEPREGSSRRELRGCCTTERRTGLVAIESREDRYKAKNFIATAVYRAGDQVGAWSYALVGFIGWGIKEAGIIAIVLSALWLANSLWLGKRQEVLAEQQAIADRNNAEAAATA